MALIIALLIQPVITGGHFAAADVVVIALFGLVCFDPSGLFVRAVIRS